MLKLDRLCARYDTSAGYVNAVEDISFTVEKDTIFGIAGESGCGKSTLLKVMYGLLDYPLEIYAGQVELITDDETGPNAKLVNGNIRKQWWKSISYVPQGAMHVMNPVVRVRDQFYDAITKYHKQGNKKQLEADIVHYLKELELPPEVLDAYPHQLSGGMRQRVLIAMATFLNPSVVLADEPTTALDVIVQRGILTMLARVQKKLKNSMVIVSHDMGVHYQITDRLGIMYAGQMIEIGPTLKIFEHPQHPYTKMLIAALPRVGDNSQKEGVPGTPPNLKNPPLGCRFYDRCPYAMARCKTENPKAQQINENHVASCHLLETRE